MSLRASGRLAIQIAAMSVVVLTASSALAQGRTLFSTTSGPWSEDIWSNRADLGDAAPPGPQDTVFIQAAHTVTVTAGREPARAETINVYGTLSMPTPPAGQPGARVETRQIRLRGGALVAIGPHEIVLSGQEPSFIATQSGATLHLEGLALVPQSAATAFEELGDGTARLTDTGQIWIPDALVGQRLKWLSGRGRLWSMTVLSNTEDSLLLDMESRGAPRTVPPFTASPHPTDRRALLSAGATFSIDPRGYRDQIVAGRYARIGGDEGRIHLIIGFEDGPDDGVDTLRVWPPIPADQDSVEVSLTWGIAPGDLYTITAPLTVTTPETFALPNPSQGRRHYIYVGDNTRSVFRHVHLDHGFLDVRWINGDTEFESTTLSDIEIAHYDAGCGFHSAGLDNVIIEGLHIRDVHPDNDNVEHGGRWPMTSQRGHGLCYYGNNATLRDNLLTNLNDDMIYTSAGSNFRIEGNISIKTAIFHGNSGESITVWDYAGDVLVRGNVAFGAWVVGLFDTRTHGGEVTIRDNIFVQDQGRNVVIDRSYNPEGQILWTNNIFINGRDGEVMANAEHNPSDFVDNVMIGVGFANVRRAHQNILVGLDGQPHPLALGGGLYTSNLFTAPGLIEGGALITRGAGQGGPQMHLNTFDAGLGAAVKIPTGDPVATFTQNLWLGSGAFDAPSATPSSLGKLQIEDNAFGADIDLSSIPEWLSDAIDASNTQAPIQWSTPDLYQLPSGSDLLSPNDPRGFNIAGLNDLSTLPLSLEGIPARRSSTAPPPPDVLTPEPTDPDLAALPDHPDASENPEPRPTPQTETDRAPTIHDGGCQTQPGAPAAPGALFWCAVCAGVVVGRRRGLSLPDPSRWP